MRGLYYDAFKAATEPALHSVITGTAPAGAKLTLTQVVHARHARRPCGRRASRPQVRAFPNALDATITVPASGKFEWHVNPSLRPSQYTRPVRRRVLHARLHRGRRHGAGDDDDQDRPRPGRQPLASARRAASAARSRRRSALTLGAPATFGAFTPGVAKEYDATATANVDQHGGQRGARGRRPGPGQHRQAGQRRVRARPAAARGRFEPGRRRRRRARGGRRLRQPHISADLVRSGQQRPGDGGLQAGHRRRRCRCGRGRTARR